MSMPLEGSRDVYDGIIISMVPDICLTPAGGGMVPVPYTIWCRQADAANLANSVRQTDDRSHAVASIVLHCYGDEPGTGGGVYSGTTGAECTPKTWSPSVRAEGRNMVRHTDQWWMNHRNTYGKLIYMKDINEYDTPPPEQIRPQIVQTSNNYDPTSASVPQSAQLLQASLSLPVETPMGPLPGPAQVQQLQNVGSALQQGYNEQFGPGTMPILQRPAANLRRAKEAIESLIGANVRQTQKKCPSRRFCFPGTKYPDKAAEYVAQLKMQNAALNKINPCHYILNRITYQLFGSAAMQGISASARRAARAAFANGGGDLTDMAALHSLDMVAGGDPQGIAAMGDKGINSEIGNAWKGVVPQMDQYASQLCDQGCPRMKAILEVCGSPTS